MATKFSAKKSKAKPKKAKKPRKGTGGSNAWTRYIGTNFVLPD